MKKVLLIVGLILAVIVAAGGIYFWKVYQDFMKVEAVSYDPQLTIYLGGGNSIVLTSADGSSALVVDTKMRGAAEVLRNRIKARDIIIVNTHSHFDHVGGNALYPQAKIIAGEYKKEQWDTDSHKLSRYPDIALKPGEVKILYVGDETVHIRNMGRAHTWNDTVVYLEKRKMLVTGDLVFHRMHPALVSESGTNVASWISVLDTISGSYEIRTLIPGHGAVADQNALAAMKDYFVTLGDAADHKDKQAAAREKYKNHIAFPGVLGFNQTLKFVEQERKETAESYRGD